MRGITIEEFTEQLFKAAPNANLRTNSLGARTDEMYQRIEEIDKELEQEYKDGESAWAANLEAEKEELEERIAVLEAAE